MNSDFIESFCPMCKDMATFTKTFDGVKANGVKWIKGFCMKCGHHSNDLAQNLSVDNYELQFGKHKGKKLAEVPKDYLQWLLDNTEQSILMKYRIRSVLSKSDTV